MEVEDQLGRSARESDRRRQVGVADRYRADVGAVQSNRNRRSPYIDARALGQVLPQVTLILGAEVSRRPRWLGAKNIFVMDEVLEGIGCRFGAWEPQRREHGWPAAQALNDGRIRGGGYPVLLGGGPSGQLRNDESDGGRVALPKDHVGDQVTRAPTGTQGLRVGANGVKKIGERRSFSGGERPGMLSRFVGLRHTSSLTGAGRQRQLGGTAAEWAYVQRLSPRP